MPIAIKSEKFDEFEDVTPPTIHKIIPVKTNKQIKTPKKPKVLLKVNG